MDEWMEFFFVEEMCMQYAVPVIIVTIMLCFCF